MFEKDCTYNKLDEIFKIKDELADVKAYLLSNYRALKEIFDYWA